MNFFQSLVQLDTSCNWLLNISPVENDMLTVSVLLQPLHVEDKAVKALAPLNITATAAELDEAFFATIETPVKQTNALFAKIEGYAKSLENVKAKSKLGKAPNKPLKQAAGASEEDGADDVENEDAPQIPVLTKEQKKKAYDEAMKQVEKLNSALKYQDALAALPSATDYPEKAKEIEAQRLDLERKQKQMSLFYQEL